MEDQPLPADASPTTLSPGYIADFNLEEDEEDPEEDPADHPVDGGDNDDNESSDDDDDDDDVVKDTKAFETDESASTPPTSPHHIILFSKTKSRTETMTTVNQGMSVEEIERVVAQRVANAIEAIAIYPFGDEKTNMARNSIKARQNKQECMCLGIQEVDHSWTQDYRNPTAAWNQQLTPCYESVEQLRPSE
ncbi:hypothetical protein Tco_0644340 [Tanacetum coccineum]